MLWENIGEREIFSIPVKQTDWIHARRLERLAAMGDHCESKCWTLIDMAESKVYGAYAVNLGFAKRRGFFHSDV